MQRTPPARKKCSVLYMAIFTKYGIKLITNGHWEQPLRMEFLQWVFQPHSGRNIESIALSCSCQPRSSSSGSEQQCIRQPALVLARISMLNSAKAVPAILAQQQQEGSGCVTHRHIGYIALSCSCQPRSSSNKRDLGVSHIDTLNPLLCPVPASLAAATGAAARGIR